MFHREGAYPTEAIQAGVWRVNAEGGLLCSRVFIIPGELNRMNTMNGMDRMTFSRPTIIRISL
jgi:hypothetical protein